MELKHIKPHRVVHIRRTEINNIFGTFFRYHGQQLFGGITMRIDEGKTPAVQHILQGHIF